MRKLSLLGAVSLAAVFAGGCAVSASSGSRAESGAVSEPAATGKADAATQARSDAVAESGPSAEAKASFAAKLVFSLEGAGLAAPEAVLYDPEEDVYLVSNVSGDPLAKDGNGFISKVSPEGKIIELKFIDGSSANT